MSLGEAKAKTDVVYCALFLTIRRTRYRCTACEIPLGLVGSGQVEHDCVTLCQENETTRAMVMRKFISIKKQSNEQKM